MLSWSRRSFPSVVTLFPFLIINMAHFSIINFIPIYWLYILNVSIIVFFFLFWEFFTPVIADSFSLECEWQQFSSGFQDSSQYSGRSQKCCSVNGLHFSSYFQVFPLPYQTFGDYTECTNYNLCHRFSCFMVYCLSFVFCLFSFPIFWQGLGTYRSFHFLLILLFSKFSFFFFFLFCWLSLGLVVWPRLDDPFVSQNPTEFYASHFHWRILNCTYTICSHGQI